MTRESEEQRPRGYQDLNRRQRASGLMLGMIVTAFGCGAPAPDATTEAGVGDLAGISDGDPVTLGTYRVIHSEILKEDRTLQVRLPRGYEESNLDHPVILLFYSDLVELYFAEAVHELAVLETDRIPQAILVGVANTQRYRDLLPWPTGDGRGGQADRFLRFVIEELIPFIETEYRTQPFRIVVGPQAAAEFGAYALMEAPETFHAFIIENPCGIDSPERSLCRNLAEFVVTSGVAGKYLSITALSSPPRPALDYLVELEEELQKASPGDGGIRWRIDIRDSAGTFIYPTGIREGLLDLFRAFPFPEESVPRNLTGILAHYQGLSESLGFVVHPPDLVLSRQSDWLTTQERHDDALEILTHLNLLYPVSMNGYWRLANLHREMGDTSKAIRYYEECLRRDPNMDVAREWLDRLLGSG